MYSMRRRKCSVDSKGLTFLVIKIAEMVDSRPIAQKVTIWKVMGGRALKLFFFKPITRKRTAKPIRKSSTLTATVEKGKKNKGNFGYSGVKIRRAAPMYLRLEFNGF